MHSVEIFEFQGRFVCRDQTSDWVPMTVTFSPTHGNRIRGTISGAAEESAECCRFIGLGEPLEIESEGAGISLTGVLLHHVTDLSFPSSRPLPATIGEFSCDEFRWTEETGRTDEHHEFSFRLDGPFGPWMPNDVLPPDWERSETLGPRRQPLTVGSPRFCSVEFRNYYLGDTDVVPLLRIKSSDTANLSTAELLEEATVLAEDLLALVTFTSRHGVTWYRCEHLGPGFRAFRRRCGARATEDRPSLNKSIVGGDVCGFIESTLPSYREVKARGHDLKKLFLTSTSRTDSGYVEEKFMAQFFAFEKLLSTLVADAGRDTLFKTKAFTKLRRSLKATLAEADPIDSPWGEWEDVVQLVEKKLPELARPPVSAVFDWICDSYGVDWRDLYPAGIEHPRFFRTRNELVHSHRGPENILLLRESKRVRAVFERLILAMLGWKGTADTKPRDLLVPLDAEL